MSSIYDDDPNIRHHFRSLLLSVKRQFGRKNKPTMIGIDKKEFRAYSCTYRAGRLANLDPDVAEAFEVALEQLPMYPGEDLLAGLERIEAGILWEDSVERQHVLRFVDTALWVLRKKRDQAKRKRHNLVRLKSKDVVSLDLYRVAARRSAPR